MLSFVFFVLGLVVVGGLLFLAGSVLLGRGETQPPAELDRSPMELPDDRPVVGDDLRALRISVSVRGYRMTEVDWLIDQLARALDERDTELALLRGPGASPGDRGGAAGIIASAIRDHDPVGDHGVRPDDGLAAGPGSTGEEVHRA